MKFFYSRPLLAVVICTLLLFGVAESCRKADPVSHTYPLASVIELENKFFRSYRSDNAEENDLIHFLQRKNKQLHFVEKTVQRIGFPRWDKALFVASNSIQKGTEHSEGYIMYIPFVRDNQNFVNAALAIRVSEKDTIFTYMCDWQYSQYANGNMNDAGTAENLAVLLMVLDNKVMGHTRFLITDSSLFRSYGMQRGYTHRELVIGNSPEQARLVADEPYVCYYTYYCGSISWCTARGGCDYMNCPSNICTLISQNCEYYYESPGPGTEQPGGTPAPPVTSGGGEGSPPPCPGGISGRGADPCGGGWEPVPVDDDPEPPFDPCSKIDSIRNVDDFRTAFSSLKNRTALGREYGYTFYTSGSITMQEGPVDGKRGVNFEFSNHVFCFLHSHFQGGLPIFSGGDFETIAALYNNGIINPSRFFAGVATETGSYVITIENPRKFGAFIDKYIDSYVQSEKFESLYKAYKIGTYSTPDDNIKAFLQLMDRVDSGTGLLKANDDYTRFTKLTVVDNQLQLVPCD